MTVPVRRAGVSPAPPIERVLGPFREFVHTEVAGGIVLMIAVVVALVWANSDWSDSYFDFWQHTITVGAGDAALSKPLQLWINDGLMAIFFFVVGLEIKREILVGELASVRGAVFPIAAALGGAAVPAGLFLALNAGEEGASGWGVPMATDIAFSLGVLTLLGSRVPTTLKIFLTAFAIVDDLVAVLVIALFYTADLKPEYLLLAGGIFVLLVATNMLHIRHSMIYGLLGIGLWFAFLQSGIHATVAGVLLAMTIPARTRIDPAAFVEIGRESLDNFERAGPLSSDILTNREHQRALHHLQTAMERVETPMQRLEHALHPWSAFLIVPLFALANAGVWLRKDLLDALTSPLALGIGLGLVVGKQVGITALAWIAVRLGVTSLPQGLGWRHIYGASWLGGIGFTMSLFIAGLAFADDPEILARAKVGILFASVISGITGYLLLRWLLQPGVEEVGEVTTAPTGKSEPQPTDG